MNVQAIAVGAAGLSGVSTDALVVVLTPAHKAVAGDTALDRALQSAVKAGDLQIKPGQSLYLHGVEGVKAPRVLFMVARDGSAKAFRAAVAAALTALKGRSFKSLAVAPLDDATDAHAEALCLVLEQAGYVYTHTKPSAESAVVPAKTTLLVATLEALKRRLPELPMAVRIRATAGGKAAAAGDDGFDCPMPPDG